MIGSFKRTSRSEIHGWLILLAAALLCAGCTAQRYRASIDRAAYGIVAEKQREALGETNLFTIDEVEGELRERLMLTQKLPHSSPASLGTRYLEPIPHWPRDNYLDRGTNAAGFEMMAVKAMEPHKLTLVEALQVAAQNSREYQGQKESVFRSALDLELERDAFRTTFAGVLGGAYVQDRTGLQEPGGEINESVSANAALDVTRRLKNGAQLSLQLGWDVIRLLEPDRFTSRSVFGDASISIPLLRGAGRHIVAEPLTQSERDALYAIYDFQEFKRSFAVNIASTYLSVLQRQNEVDNVAENYRGLIASTRRARRWVDSGRLEALQEDQAVQDELNARNRWVSARESYTSALDAFKMELGLPTDAIIALDPAEFDKLSGSVSNALQGATAIRDEAEVPPADAPIVLQEPTMENAGPLELAPERAIRLALEHRLDLRIARGQVYDAQRRVVVAADRLKAEVSLFGSARITGEDVEDLDFDTGDYEALLNVDLPLERTAEAVAYRESFISLEQAVRSLQQLEDDIKLDVMNSLRQLREARESLRIQALSVELARRRVRGANLMVEAGRAEMRDLLEAQEDLLSAQNSLTAAKVNYRVAELSLQRDLGVLDVGPDGLWTEYKPEDNNES